MEREHALQVWWQSLNPTYNMQLFHPFAKGQKLFYKKSQNKEKPKLCYLFDSHTDTNTI